jgi:hypothetical protein
VYTGIGSFWREARFHFSPAIVRRDFVDIPSKEQIVEAAVIAARAQGCTCNVEIEVIGVVGRYTPEINIKHDDDCPLLRAVELGSKSRDQFFVTRW